MNQRIRISWIVGCLSVASVIPSRADDGAHGLHLIAGAGLNAAAFHSSGGLAKAGIGLNLRTDVGYYFPQGFGVELGTNVNFNRTDEGHFLVWQTLVTLGIRTRLPFVPSSETFTPFGKFFGGYGTAVVYPGSQRPGWILPNADRAQLQGPAAGLSLGVSTVTKGGRVWFYEVSGTVQRFDLIEFVKVDREVAEVIGKSDGTNHTQLRSIYVTVSTVLF